MLYMLVIEILLFRFAVAHCIARFPDRNISISDSLAPHELHRFVESCLYIYSFAPLRDFFQRIFDKYCEKLAGDVASFFRFFY